MTVPICGRRNGGSSSVNEEGIPFSAVMESSLEATSVATTPTTMTMASKKAAPSESKSPPDVPIQNMEIIAIIVGNGRYRERNCS